MSAKILDFYRKRAVELARNVSEYAQEGSGLDANSRAEAAALERKFIEASEVGVVCDTEGRPY